MDFDQELAQHIYRVKVLERAAHASGQWHALIDGRSVPVLRELLSDGVALHFEIPEHMLRGVQSVVITDEDGETVAVRSVEVGPDTKGIEWQLTLEPSFV